MLYPIMYYDSTYWIFAIVTLVISLAAQAWVSSAYKRYSNVGNIRGITGAQAAELILRRQGIDDVNIELINGMLGDHYDPRKNVIRLSPQVFNGTSVAAVGIAAHEAGHAIQHRTSYVPIKLRSAIYPVANLGYPVGIFLVMLGLFFTGGSSLLVDIGLILFSATAIFHFVTLPVEFNASRRAMKLLADNGILYEQELHGARKVLTAAAMTYVAATVVSVLQLLRLLLLVNRRRN